MMNDFFQLMEVSSFLEPKVFSLIRIKLVHSLYQLHPEGATFREFSSGMKVPDGLLYSNLKALEEMGMIRSEKVEIEGKILESFYMTEMGREEWGRALEWLREFICREE